MILCEKRAAVGSKISTVAWL